MMAMFSCTGWRTDKMKAMAGAMLLVVTCASYLGSRVGQPTDAFRVEYIQISPDTMALKYNDQGIMTVICFNEHDAVIACRGGIKWTVRNPAIVAAIATRGNTATALAKASGTTWVVVKDPSERGKDSTKIVVTSGAPAPIPPTPPESVWIAFSRDTVEMDSASSDTARIRTYANSGLTSQTLGRPLSVSTTNAAIASYSPTSGSSSLLLTVTGTSSGTSRLIATSSFPGRRDTLVVVVNPVAGEPDTTSVPPPVVACPGGAIDINPGDNWQAKANAAATGATFCVRAGIHRHATVAPKASQKFYGETGAIMSGAKVLTGWVVDGSRWYVTGQTQGGTQDNGTCLTSHPRCRYPQDLFINDSLQKHESSLAAVGAGEWFFDYTADRIYVGSSPTGKTVETGVTPQAFVSSVTNGEIHNLTIEKYATPAQSGAIHISGSGWTVADNIVRWNHGGGIRGVRGGDVLRNLITANGQLGIGCGGCPGILVEDNEISYNNTARYSDGWEAGGSKWAVTNGLTVRGNHSHHNIESPGLWTDIDNFNVIYEDNIVEFNAAYGIQHEISFNAIIRNNTITGNGTSARCGGGVACAGIAIHNSRDVEIHNNTLSGNFNGIVLLEQNRGVSDNGFGAFLTRNIETHDNTVTQSRTGSVAAGLVQQTGDPTAFASTTFEDDDYFLPASGNFFHWLGSFRTDSQWQTTYGHDNTGTIDR